MLSSSRRPYPFAFLHEAESVFVKAGKRVYVCFSAGPDRATHSPLWPNPDRRGRSLAIPELSSQRCQDSDPIGVWYFALQRDFTQTASSHLPATASQAPPSTNTRLPYSRKLLF